MAAIPAVGVQNLITKLIGVVIAGTYTALLRIIGKGVDLANEILDIEQMDIDGEEIKPDNRNIHLEHVSFAYENIMGLPDGYDTVIGEGGATISGGEKQRISIARAIMKDAPIIILDEATADVDPECEKELTEAIENLTKQKNHYYDCT